MSHHQQGSHRYVEEKSLVTEEVFLAPRSLSNCHVQNCVVLPDRFSMLEHLPRQGRIAEVGTLKGTFAKSILEVCQPQELHLFDLSFSWEGFPFDHQYFGDFVGSGRVVLHEGDSSTLLRELADGYFDWIYIDGDHTFEGVTKDIVQAKQKIREDGYLVFNDYTIYSPFELVQYGVQRAVNDICIDDDFELIYFALSVFGYHDVCLRKMRHKQ